MAEHLSIWLNERACEWQPGRSVADWLASQGLPCEGVATALNGSFLPRDRRATTVLQPGDRLSVFQAIVGG